MGKNLIKKILPYFLIGGFILLSSCNPIKLKKYNKKNLQVYQDASQLVRERGDLTFNAEGFIQFSYEQFKPNIKYCLALSNNKNLVLKKSHKVSDIYTRYVNYADKKGNGLDFTEEAHICLDDYTIGMIWRRDFPLNSKILLDDAKEYTKDLKHIMHNAKYKNY